MSSKFSKRIRCDTSSDLQSSRLVTLIMLTVLTLFDVIYVEIISNLLDSAPWDSKIIVSGTHLVDTDGHRIAKSNLNMSMITLCMLSAIDLSHNQVDLLHENDLISFPYHLCNSFHYRHISLFHVQENYFRIHLT
jgi:hypothetical protein